MELSDLDVYQGKINFGNHYHDKENSIPRVTEIISRCTHEDYLMQWANNLGFKHQSYHSVLNRAADYGTKVHSALEKYIKTGKIDIDAPINPIEAFEKWWDGLHQIYKDIKVVGQEFTLTCPYFGGTYDMLLKLDGKYCLVDFKTSNHLSYKYCLQVAAYSYMLNYNHICNVDRTIILRLYKDRPTYETFMLDMENAQNKAFFDDCLKEFLGMVYTYWMDKNVQSQYETLTKKKSYFER